MAGRSATNGADAPSRSTTAGSTTASETMLGAKKQMETSRMLTTILYRYPVARYRS